MLGNLYLSRWYETMIQYSAKVIYFTARKQEQQRHNNLKENQIFFRLFFVCMRVCVSPSKCVDAFFVHRKVQTLSRLAKIYYPKHMTRDDILGWKPNNEGAARVAVAVDINEYHPRQRNNEKTKLNGTEIGEEIQYFLRLIVCASVFFKHYFLIWRRFKFNT